MREALREMIGHVLLPLVAMRGTVFEQDANFIDISRSRSNSFVTFHRGRPTNWVSVILRTQPAKMQARPLTMIFPDKDY